MYVDRTPLDELTLTVLDFETTGLSPSGGDRVIEVAGGRLEDQLAAHTEHLSALKRKAALIQDVHGESSDSASSGPPIETSDPSSTQASQ